MDTVNLRTAIADALDHEQRTSELDYLLRSRLYKLHGNIRISAGDPATCLVVFVRDYVQRLPDILDSVREISALQDTEEDAEITIDRCTDFFIRPPRPVVGHHGLNGAMNMAYMAHRLLEEVNDQHLVSRGKMLAPLDITRSNLIIHQLIGESSANQLDEAVHLIATDVINLWRDNQQQTAQPDRLPPLAEMLSRWPYLHDHLVGDPLHLLSYNTPSIH